MQVSVETSEGLERTITVTVPAERVDSAVSKRLQSMRKNVKINGFRPGKVPARVVEKRYGAEARQEVVGDVVQSSYQEAIKQEELRPAGWPSIEVVESDNTEEFSYKATFEVYPELTLGDLSKIEVSRPATTIVDGDIDEMLESLRGQHTSFEKEDRACADGDQVVIDFVGFVDGEEFAGGKADEAPLVLGSGAMIEGFEAQIEGMSAGDEKRIKVTFPENYHSEELSGKEAEFDIKLKEVRASVKPELNDEFAEKLGVTEGGMDTLKSDIQKNMERELLESVSAVEKQQVMDGLIEVHEVAVPKALITDEVGRLREQFLERLSQQMGGQKPPEGIDLPDDMFKDEAERRVKLGLIVAEVVKSAELSATPEAVRERVEQMATAYEDPTEVIDYYYSNRELLQNVEAVVLEQAVTDWVITQSTSSEETLTFSELMERRKNGGQEAPADNGGQEAQPAIQHLQNLVMERHNDGGQEAPADDAEA